jgi:hypothetical protein
VSVAVIIDAGRIVRPPRAWERLPFGNIMLKSAFLLVALAASSAASAATVHVPNPVPYDEDADIAGNIKRECRINEQLAEYIRQFAPAGTTIEFYADAPPADGKVLDIVIRDAVSSGNAFIGHRKYVTVRGKLRDGEQVTASFKGRRDSMGGAFAGYKGSCSVLGRTVKALGKDIGEWLASPSMDADLGDMK